MKKYTFTILALTSFYAAHAMQNTTTTRAYSLKAIMRKAKGHANHLKAEKARMRLFKATYGTPKLATLLKSLTVVDLTPNKQFLMLPNSPMQRLLEAASGNDLKTSSKK